MNKNVNRPVVIIMTVILMLLGIGAAGYFVHTSQPESSADSTLYSNQICDTDECFQEKFVKCEPASLQQKAVFSGGSKAYYEILGGDTANCKMLYRTDSDDLDLVCTYQDTGSYSTGRDVEFVLAAAKNETDIALGKETNCTGPKVERLQQTKPVTDQN